MSASIRQFPCYYGKIGAPKAEELLRTHRIGTFIIRDSSREGAFATSYSTESGVRHSLVLVDDQVILILVYFFVLEKHFIQILNSNSFSF